MGTLPQREACGWWSETLVTASRALIGEETRAAMNMDEGAIKGLIQQGREDGPPPLKSTWPANNTPQFSHKHMGKRERGAGCCMLAC